MPLSQSYSLNWEREGIWEANIYKRYDTHANKMMKNATITCLIHTLQCNASPTNAMRVDTKTSQHDKSRKNA